MPPTPPCAAPRPTVAEAVALLDAQFPWLRASHSVLGFIVTLGKMVSIESFQTGQQGVRLVRSASDGAGARRHPRPIQPVRLVFPSPRRRVV